MFENLTNKLENIFSKLKSATQKIVTEPNSLLCIQSTTVKHAVTPLKKGERIILKGLLVAEGEEILDDNNFEEALKTYS